MSKVVSEEVMQELITKLESVFNNYCWNLEYFTDEEVNGFFQGGQEEITYYNGLINDNIESKNFLWSSKKVAEELSKKIIEANDYTDSLLGNISSIQLRYVTSLPTSEISENTIYILKASDSSSKDTLNLYNATDGWTSIGEFTIDLTNYIDRTTYDTDMDLKANKTEVVANDKIVQTLDSATNSSDTVLSTSGLQVEMDKKANDNEVIKKTSLVTSIDSSSTEDTVPGALTVYNAIYNLIGLNKGTNVLTVKRQPVTSEGGEIRLEIPATDCDLNGNVVIDSYKNYIRFFENGGDYRGCKIDLSNMKNRTSSNICTTNISDVPATDIVFTDSNVSIVNSNEFCKYCVKNGVCYVTLNGLTFNSNYVKGTTFANLPKPVFRQDFTLTNSYGDVSLGKLFLETYGGIHLYTDTTPVPDSGFISFSYPVAEQ